eukprot:jgi/Chlat1/3390/Chrsp23S03732
MTGRTPLQQARYVKPTADTTSLCPPALLPSVPQSGRPTASLSYRMQIAGRGRVGGPCESLVETTRPPCMAWRVTGGLSIPLLLCGPCALSIAWKLCQAADTWASQSPRTQCRASRGYAFNKMDALALFKTPMVHSARLATQATPTRSVTAFHPSMRQRTGAYTLDASQQFNWNDGQIHCESIGGTLAQIYSLAERNTILSKIAPYTTVWIGLSRNADIDGPEWDALPCPPGTVAQCPARVNLFHWGGHSWGTGTIPQTYQDWWIDNDGIWEPDNTFPSRDEYCVFMVGYGNKPPKNPGTWDDDLCYNAWPVVCSGANT